MSILIPDTEYLQVIGIPVQFSKGQVIFYPQHRPDGAYYFCSGQVHAFSNQCSENFAEVELKKFIGLHEIYQDQSYYLGLIAVTNSEGYFFGRHCIHHKQQWFDEYKSHWVVLA